MVPAMGYDSSGLDHPPTWDSFDADADGGLTVYEEASFLRALDAWEKQKRRQASLPIAPDGDRSDLPPDEWVTSDFDELEIVGRRLDEEAAWWEAKRRFEWKQEPLSVRIGLRIKSFLSFLGRATIAGSKVLLWLVAALMFVFGSSIVLWLMGGGPACLSPWFDC